MTIPLKRRPDGLGEFEPNDVVPVEHGGTGADTLTGAQDLLGISDKLDRSEYIQHFLGVFPSKSALDAAHPTARQGDYADIDSGADFDVMRAIWDDTDQKWVVNEVGNASNTDEVPEGSQNLYFKSERVLDTILNGFTTAISTAVVSTDKVIVGFGKLQAQINSIVGNLSTNVRNTVLTGVVFTNKAKVTTADSIETAVGKLQGQLEDAGLQTWVDINTLASVAWHANIDTSKSKIEISKYQNTIYVRGYIWFSGAIGGAGVKFVGHKQAGYMCDIAYLQSATSAAGLARFYMSGSNSSLLLDARQEQLLGDEFALVSVNAVSAGNIYHIAQTAVGKAKN